MPDWEIAWTAIPGNLVAMRVRVLDRFVVEGEPHARVNTEDASHPTGWSKLCHELPAGYLHATPQAAERELALLVLSCERGPIETLYDLELDYQLTLAEAAAGIVPQT